MATYSAYSRPSPPIPPHQSASHYPSTSTQQPSTSSAANAHVRSLPPPPVPTPRSSTLPPHSGANANDLAASMAHMSVQSRSPPPGPRRQRPVSVLSTVASPPNFAHTPTPIQPSISTTSTSTALSSSSAASSQAISSMFRAPSSNATTVSSHYNTRPSHNHTHSGGSSSNNYGNMAAIPEVSEALDEDDRFPPDYDIAVSRNNNANAGTGSAHWSIPFDDPPGPLTLRRRPSRTRQNQERYLYTYAMLVGTLPLQFLISVEPVNESSSRGRTIFQVSLKANGIERPLGEPVERFLTIDPKTLEFVVFVFPGNASLPANCQFSVRIWLRSNGIDHRIFGMDALWIGKDPDFNALKDASFARLKNVESNKQIYHGFVGKALVNYIVRWKHLGGGLYDYSMEYEGGGVGGVLFEDMKLRFEGNPRQVTFSIYTVPMESKPPGASHQLRVWLRSLISLSTTDPYSLPFNDSYIYQRIYKNDGFKIGGKLDFASLNTKVVMGFSTGQPQVIPVVEAQVVRDDDSTRSRSTSETKSRRNIDSYTGQ